MDHTFYIATVVDPNESYKRYSNLFHSELLF